MKALYHLNHTALPLINTHTLRGVLPISNEYFRGCFIFMAATIWTGLNRVTRHSHRPLSHEKCTSHLKPMASHTKTLGPSRQTATFFLATREKQAYFQRPPWKRMPSPCVHIRYEDWMKWFDSETLASFKSYACWAFFKCTARLII